MTTPKLDYILNVVSRIECYIRRHKKVDVDGLIYCELCRTILAEPEEFTWRATIMKEMVLEQGFKYDEHSRISN